MFEVAALRLPMDFDIAHRSYGHTISTGLYMAKMKGIKPSVEEPIGYIIEPSPSPPPKKKKNKKNIWNNNEIKSGTKSTEIKPTIRNGAAAVPHEQIWRWYHFPLVINCGVMNWNEPHLVSSLVTLTYYVQLSRELKKRIRNSLYQQGDVP